jgi:hypothetical protein
MFSKMNLNFCTSTILNGLPLQGCPLYLPVVTITLLDGTNEVVDGLIVVEAGTVVEGIGVEETSGVGVTDELVERTIDSELSITDECTLELGLRVLVTKGGVEYKELDSKETVDLGTLVNTELKSSVGLGDSNGDKTKVVLVELVGSKRELVDVMKLDEERSAVDRLVSSGDVDVTGTDEICSIGDDTDVRSSEGTEVYDGVMLGTVV